MVSAFLSVDPGKKTGWAEWLADGRLVKCGLTNGDAPVLPQGLPLLVIEKPHEGQGKASKGDLMILARRMERAIMMARAEKTIEIFPVQWKGSVPKRVRLLNGKVVEPALDVIRAKMNENDRAVFARDCAKVAKSAQNNVLDAIGIGLFYLGIRGVR